jgi:hypothetical protein
MQLNSKAPAHIDAAFDLPWKAEQWAEFTVNRRA